MLFGSECSENELGYDDSLDAFGCHGVGGIWGALATGLFATKTINPAGADGLFYGNTAQLGIQAISIVTTIALAVTATFVILKVIGLFIKLRATSEEEELGLDLAMHGEEAYPDTFGHGLTSQTALSIPMGVGIPSIPIGAVSTVAAQPEISVVRSSDIKMTKVVLIIKQEKFEALKTAMSAIGITGMTVTQVLGFGMQKGAPEYYRGVRVDATLLPKVKVEIVVSKIPVSTVIETAQKVLHTGRIGDGKIFVYDVENVVKVRTGEQGYDALQDEE